jgi:hypothetical protein
MSYYDKLKLKLQKLLWIQNLCTTFPAFAVVAVSVYLIEWPYSWIVGAIVTMAAAIVVPWIFHSGLRAISGQYNELVNERLRLEKQAREIRTSVQKIYDKYPKRPKGKQFKIAYALNGRELTDFEKVMAIGMKYEGREVFVTAFVRKKKVVRVTASIGSVFQCSNADNPRRWPDHYQRLGCDELRQYHNHPVNRNRTVPSFQDRKSSAKFEEILNPAGISLQSFIIYWNEIYEWRLLKYDAGESTELKYCFDVTNN